jgi:hypothetical protein
VVTATEGSGATVTATVHVEFAPVRLGRTGCSSAAPADLIAILMLGLAMPRRKRKPKPPIPIPIPEHKAGIGIGIGIETNAKPAA